jgi:hypothetical protein
VGQTRFAIDAQQLHSRFDDGAVSPVDFNLNSPSPDEAAHDSSPVVGDALQPAIFSFSASRPNSAIHLGQQSLLNRSHGLLLGETVNNLIFHARARRRVLAQQMHQRLCLRALHSIMCEWQQIVVAADATDRMNYVRRGLVAQRCRVFSRFVFGLCTHFHLCILPFLLRNYVTDVLHEPTVCICSPSCGT